MRRFMRIRTLLASAFLLSSIAACDGVGPEAPPRPKASAVAAGPTKGDPAGIVFTFRLDRPDGSAPAPDGGPWAGFDARILSRSADGTVDEQAGTLYFLQRTADEAGGRVRTVRYLVAGRDGEWTRGFVASIPDLDEAEQVVLGWLLGGPSRDPGGEPITYAEGNCRVEQLDPSDPACNDQDPENCWATVCDGGGGNWPPPPDDGGGGSGSPGDSSGPGSPGDDCDPTAIDRPPHCDQVDPPEEERGPQVANGNEMRAEIKNQCSTVDSDAKANNVFQGSVRASLNAVYALVSPSPNHGVFLRYPTRTVPNHHGGGPRDLDGYVYSSFGGETLTSAILEVKNSSNLTDRNVEQAEDHIMYLSSQRRPGANWAPTYFYASHAGESNPRIVALAAFANARGVNFAHVSIHWTSSSKTDLEFESGIVGTVMDGNGPLAWWHQVLFRIDRTYDFEIACNNPEA